MNPSLNHIQGGLGGWLFVFQMDDFIWLTPGLRVFEGEPAAVFPGASSPGWLGGGGRAVQHPVATHGGHYPAALTFQRTEEPMVAIFGVCDHHIQDVGETLPGLSQAFNLLHPAGHVGLRTGYPLDI
jgi:hypothetical protein